MNVGGISAICFPLKFEYDLKSYPELPAAAECDLSSSGKNGNEVQLVELEMNKLRKFTTADNFHDC